jgi:hypothetical protein
MRTQQRAIAITCPVLVGLAVAAFGSAIAAAPPNAPLQTASPASATHPPSQHNFTNAFSSVETSKCHLPFCYFVLAIFFPGVPEQPLDFGVPISVSIWHSVKTINRHGTSCALLIFIVVLCVVGHSIAAQMMSLLKDVPAAYLPLRLVRNVTGIQFLDTNWGFSLAYSLLFLGTLIYMEIRSTPRWAVWVTFALMTLPSIGYVVLCLHVGTRSLVISGPNHL